MRRPYISILASTAEMSQLNALSVERAQEHSAILPTLPIVQTIMLSSARSNAQTAAGGRIGSQFMALIPQRVVIYLDWSRVWLEPICIGCGSGDFIGGVE